MNKRDGKNTTIGRKEDSFPASRHDDSTAQQTYLQQELASILATTEQHASPASRTLRPRDMDACKQILQECPQLCRTKLPFGHRLGYGVHTSQVVSPLLQLCYRQAPLELIQTAYDAYPDALNEKDADDFTALHWACCGTFTSVEVVRFLVDQHPASVYHTTWGHCTPLHHACRNGSTADIVKLLLEQCPHHTRERDNHQNVPLHLACGRRDASFEVVKLLTDFDPETVELTSRLGLLDSHAGIVYRSTTVYDSSGYTALHYACGEGAPLDVIRLLVRLYPAALRQQGPGMVLPLHLACSTRFPSLSIISFLTYLYPQALQQSTNDSCSETIGGGGYPLQLCVKSRPSLQVVQFLYERYPSALRMNEDAAQMTIQYACCNYASIEVIGYLLEKSSLIHVGPLPRTVNSATFLYMACSKAASDPLIVLMLERFPDDVEKASIQGNLPLHAVCESRAALSIIRRLVSKYPKALSTCNDDGNLPLHLLVKRRTNMTENMIDLGLLRFMVAQNVEALNSRNDENQAPFHLALEYLLPGPSPSPRRCYLSGSSFYQEMKGQAPLKVLMELTPREPAFQFTQRSGARTPLPLHYIAAHPQLLSTDSMPRLSKALSLLCQKDPAACRHVNDLDEMPLHLACRTKGVALKTIEFLFAQYPDAIHTPNRDGLFPFELASTVMNDENVTESLGAIYFLVHRSLFVFENLTCQQEDDSKFYGQETNESGSMKRRAKQREGAGRIKQAQTQTERLEGRDDSIHRRLEGLETELLELKERKNTSCHRCTIS